MASILLYHITGIKEAQIRLLCGGQKISLRTVQDSELHIPLGSLAGRPVPLTQKGEGTFTEEMLVLVDFTDSELDRFLGTYRESGIAPVSLKAVLTAHNQGWDSVALYRELVRERDEFLKKRMGQGK